MKHLNETGSAITEFVITLFALVPIIALFTVVGKLSDTEHSAQQGARYQAWEVALTGAPHNPANELKLEVHQRVLNPNQFINTIAQDAAVVDTNPDDRFLWGMVSPTNPGVREALVSFEDEGYANSLGSGSSGALPHNALSLDVPVLGTVGISELDIDGLYNSQINFSVNEVSSLEFDGGLNCGNGTHDSYLACMNRNNALLVDDWSAGSPGIVQDRVGKLNPALVPWELFAEGVDLVADPPGLEIQIITPAAQWYRPFRDAKEIDKAPGFVAPELVPRRNLGSYEDVGIEEALD